MVQRRRARGAVAAAHAARVHSLARADPQVAAHVLEQNNNNNKLTRRPRRERNYFQFQGTYFKKEGEFTTNFYYDLTRKNAELLRSF